MYPHTIFLFITYKEMQTTNRNGRPLTKLFRQYNKMKRRSAELESRGNVENEEQEKQPLNVDVQDQDDEPDTEGGKSFSVVIDDNADVEGDDIW